MKLIFDSYITGNKLAFTSRLKDISNRLGIDPNWLMAVMWKESLVNPQAVAPSTGASGLIQFMPATARELGTTVQAIRTMTAVQQLDYVYKFYKRYAGKLRSYPDLYKVTFFPKMLGKPQNWVLQTDKLPAETIAKYNPGIDLDKNKQITVAEFEAYTYKRIPKEFLPAVKKKINES